MLFRILTAISNFYAEKDSKSNLEPICDAFSEFEAISNFDAKIDSKSDLESIYDAFSDFDCDFQFLRQKGLHIDFRADLRCIF